MGTNLDGNKKNRGEEGPSKGWSAEIMFLSIKLFFQFFKIEDAKACPLYMTEIVAIPKKKQDIHPFNILLT